MIYSATVFIYVMSAVSKAINQESVLIVNGNTFNFNRISRINFTYKLNWFCRSYKVMQLFARLDDSIDVEIRITEDQHNQFIKEILAGKRVVKI